MWTELFFDLHDLEVFSFTAVLCVQTLPPGGAAGTPASTCVRSVPAQWHPGTVCVAQCVGTEVVGGGVPVALLMGHPLAAPLVAC